MSNRDRKSQIEFLAQCQYEDFNLSTIDAWRKPGRNDVSDLIACWLNVAKPGMRSIPFCVYTKIIDRLEVIEDKKLLACAVIDTLKIAYPRTWRSKIEIIIRAVPSARDYLAAEVIKEELNG